MDTVEIEAFIMRCLIYEAHRQNQSVLSQSVIDSIIDHFDQLAPVPNVCFIMLILRLAFVAFSSQHLVGEFSALVTPQCEICVWREPYSVLPVRHKRHVNKVSFQVTPHRSDRVDIGFIEKWSEPITPERIVVLL